MLISGWGEISGVGGTRPRGTSPSGIRPDLHSCTVFICTSRCTYGRPRTTVYLGTHHSVHMFRTAYVFRAPIRIHPVRDCGPLFSLQAGCIRMGTVSFFPKACLRFFLTRSLCHCRSFGKNTYFALKIVKHENAHEHKYTYLGAL